MAATLQTVSAGKVVLGIGAGWNEEEYVAYGWPYPSARVRIAQLAEAIQIIKAMWSESPATFVGQYYQVSNAYCEPRPDPAPPIMIGGAGEKYLLRVVAQYADWWNYVYKGRDTYAHKQAVLQSHCREVGRDYDEIVQVIHLGILVAESEKEVQRLQASPDVRSVGENDVAGTPQQVTEALLEAVDQGAQRITVHFCDAPRLEGTQLFAAEVMPHLG
jgi:alkanesulfonate monooxygenase SsuD/methylene tetrahydromethanopterin reductase-like flavin-dependent oxidoreductase (luciferase family)